MNRCKKIVSFFFALCLMAGFLPVMANASDYGENEKAFHEVPLYFQTDYPDTMFGGGTVATSGCSVTCLAMVATYLTGHEYLPDEMARYFGGSAENNIKRLELGSEAMQLPFYKSENFDMTMAALREGKVAIALMEGKSLFTASQHFIVLTGLNEEGRIMVHDPYEPNYEKWDMVRAFEEGFDEGDILFGYSGAWIYDKDAMPEETPRYIPTEDLTQVPTEHWKYMLTYFQDDYPNDRFGIGTVASSGCAVTSLAMVASYMTGHRYLPDELADWAGSHGENNMERLEYASDLLQLPYRKARNIHEVLDEVRDGNLAILLMNSKSKFTTSQHFIILTGITKNGRYMVKDSYKANYDNWELKTGFETGFTEDELIKGYDGGWIYDLNAMPEEPFIYVEEKPYVEPRYPDIDLTWEEQQLLAKVIWVEARGESAEGQQAIAEIVFNRMLSEDHPDTLREVIYAENQFRSVEFLEDATPWQAQYDAIDNALEGPYVLPLDVYHFATYPVNDHVWGEIGGHIFCYG